jgi:predicted ATPase/class 3 adenylate cyclase
MASKLPTGTVTFLFTDIEGSTKLAQEFPSELPQLLARHNAILQNAIESNQGQVFRMAGDAFCAAFHTPRQALDAAVAGQRALQAQSWTPAPVWVRMGIHTGEAQMDPAEPEMDPYVGYLTLTRVQRVMSTAHGGQVLVSNATAELVRAALPPDVALRDVGLHRLKGIVLAEQLWQVDVAGLRQEFPPFSGQDAPPSNLPGALNRLVGRAREVSEVQARLESARMLTLLGPGGTGKTRLALEVARNLLDAYGERVYFVDLAASRDAEAALEAIARVIGLREKSDAPLLQELKRRIRDQKMLLLLDNFEQVTSAADEMAELLRDCRGLQMLVTSREALNVRGEMLYPVPPLALPPVEVKRVAPEQLREFAAVQLFVERARAVKPDFALTAENAGAVADICLRLDGLPLAIELATARLNVLTPQALAERLGNRLKLLKGGARDLPERHQTLRSTIDWSYETLDPQEQELLQVLAVFSGTTLEAVETVVEGAAGAGEVEPDVLEGLASLVNKSLVRQSDDGDGNARFRMLETIREYARERLDGNAALCARARRAHASYYAEFARRQWDALTGTGRDAALDALTRELENVRTAWRYWAAERNLEELGKFTDPLWLLYDARGWYHATVQLTSELLEILATTASTPERAREEIVLQTGLARGLLATRGYTEEVERAYERALELCKGVGEIPQLFPVLRGLSSFYLLRGDYAKGAEMGQRILALGEKLDDNEMKVEGHLVLGENLSNADGLEPGMAHLEKAIATYNSAEPQARRLRLGSHPGVLCRSVSAMFLWLTGYPERARQRSAEGITVARMLNHPFSLTYAQFHYGYLQYWLGYPEIVRERGRMVMELAEEHGFEIWRAVGAALRGAGMVGSGEVEEGLQLLEQGVSEYRGLKSPPVFLPLLLTLYAAALGTAGRPADGIAMLNRAIEVAGDDAGNLMVAEVLALKGQLLLAVDRANAAEAEQLFQTALAVARQTNSRMPELRAATSLSALWKAQGKAEAARQVLAESYAGLTEGFELPDMVRARALLEEPA